MLRRRGRLLRPRRRVLADVVLNGLGPALRDWRGGALASCDFIGPRRSSTDQAPIAELAKWERDPASAPRAQSGAPIDIDIYCLSFLDSNEAAVRRKRGPLPSDARHPIERPFAERVVACPLEDGAETRRGEIVFCQRELGHSTADGANLRKVRRDSQDGDDSGRWVLFSRLFRAF